MFDDNIVSIACGRVTYNPNILPPSPEWRPLFLGDDEGFDPLALKLELINRGIRGLEYGEPTHLELEKKPHKLTVKVSAEKRIGFISPFNIQIIDGVQKLCYFDTPVADVLSQLKTVVLDEATPKGVPLKDICEIEDKTLRVRHCVGCEYVRRKAGCSYCKYTKEDFKMCGFDDNDIEYALKKYQEAKDSEEIAFDRIVIGGGCIVDPHDKVVKSVIDVAEVVRRVFGKEIPVILACPPPTMQTDMDIYRDNGITGIVISVEVFDPPKSAEYLPGKDRVPLSAFYYTLKHAVSIWGGENVFSNLIAGLEDPSTTREGCGHIASTGARPVIAPFRPIAGTLLKDLMPLPAEELYKLCKKVFDDYSQFHKNLGSIDMKRFPETVVMPAEETDDKKSQGAGQ